MAAVATVWGPSSGALPQGCCLWLSSGNWVHFSIYQLTRFLASSRGPLRGPKSGNVAMSFLSASFPATPRAGDTGRASCALEHSPATLAPGPPCFRPQPHLRPLLPRTPSPREKGSRVQGQHFPRSSPACEDSLRGLRPEVRLCRTHMKKSRPTFVPSKTLVHVRVYKIPGEFLLGIFEDLFI